MLIRDKWVVMSMGLAGALIPAAALAQGQSTATADTRSTAPADRDGVQVEEIIVTAQRTSQRLQDVPISVNAVSAAALQTRGIVSSFSLGQAVPGLQVVRTGTTSTPYLRGIGSNAANPNAEASVATYVDGVYIAAPYSTVFSFNNIDRIEVLKGPQGTLFGRNATGGVIQIVTRTPSHDTSVEMSGGFANYQTVTANGYATTGLTDTVAIDLAVSYRNQMKGYGRDLYNGAETYKSHELGLRSKLLWEPTDTTKITISGDFATSQGNDLNYVLAPGVAGSDGVVRNQGYYNTATDTRDLRKVKTWGGALDIRQDLGFATLASITARRIATGLNLFDGDSTPLPIVTFNSPQRVVTFSQELQLLSAQGSKIDWTLGAFYFTNRAAYDPARLIGIAFGPNPDSELDILGQQKTRSWSVYGQATVEIVPTVKLTGGLRYTNEKQTATWAVGVPGSLAAVGPRSTKFGRLTWRAALDWEAVNDVHLYASYNRGLKSGGFDLLSPGGDPFFPEVLDAYEVGIKSQFLNNRVRLNIAGFYYDYKNIQVSVNPRGTIVTLNAAAATVKGIDADFEIALAPGLRLTGGAGYTDAKFDDFPNPVIYPASPLDPAVSLANAKGNRLTRTPKFTGNLGLAYGFETANGKIDLNGSYYHNSGFFWDVDNRFGVGPYNVVGAGIAWTSPEKALTVRLWGENLTNEHYGYQGVSSATGDTQQFAAPRTYGFTVTTRF